MRAVCYLKPGLAVMDRPEPMVKKPDDVKIKIAYASICGSDGHILEGAFDYAYPDGKGPFIIGHESSGTITELGEGCRAKGLKVGDRVVFYFQHYCGKCHYCRSGQENLCSNLRPNMRGMCDYVVVNEQQVYRVPDEIPLRLACLAEPVSVCLRGTDLAGIKPGLSVCVFGGGAIGLLTAQLARLSGARPLVVCEPVEAKRALALEMGADYALDPTAGDFTQRVQDITGGRGFDVVLECAGIAGAAEPAFNVLGRGGTLVYTSTHHPDYRMPFNLNALWQKEATIRGVYQSPYLLERAVTMLPRLGLEKLITAEFDSADAEKAFAAQKTGQHAKIILRFGGE